MYISEIPIMMVRCLIITIFMEILVALLLGIRNNKDILNIILVNILTNPLVVTIPIYFEYKYGLVAKNISLSLLELFALLSEGLIYQKFLKYKKINGYIVSLLLNISSYLVGVIINLIIYS